ncbi:uncharacterized protein LOC142327970 [Lycorma delicatula]|uniref:uncharacterized protein LOC142327970 n=1 Tax=Lycorma delicatula TaxID=130591 RepID=UPI003F51A5DC
MAKYRDGSGNKNNEDKWDDKPLNKTIIHNDSISLPSLEIFSNDDDNLEEKNDGEKNYPQIVDLCYDDRLRISKLIEEIARCRERNAKDTNLITALQEEKFKMTMEINNLEKEKTKLVKESEEKATDIIQMSRRHSIEIEQHKTQAIELKLKIDEMTDKLKEQQIRINELDLCVKKSNDNNTKISNKYKDVKIKLKKAVCVIKKLIKEAGNSNKKTEERFCQIPSPKKCTSLNLELKIASSDNNLPATCASVVTHSNSELSLLSDLFFKPSSNLQDENNEAVLLLQEQNNKILNQNYNDVLTV